MSDPLFILTTPRSLSSLVCAMVGNHPEMIGLAETNLFAADTYEELERMFFIDQRFQHGLLRSIAELGLGEQTEDNIEMARAWLDENESVSTSDLLKDIMAMVEPLRVIDTSVLYVYKPGVIERITRNFPDAYYLHITMHPRYTCESVYKTRKAAEETHLGRLSNTKTTLHPDTMWLKPHQRVLDALEVISPDRKMFVQGEKLLSDPVTQLRYLAEWLGVQTDPDAIEAMMCPEDSPFARHGPQNALLGNDPHFLENPRFKPHTEQALDLDSPMSWDESLTFSEELKQLARSLGY